MTICILLIIILCSSYKFYFKLAKELKYRIIYNNYKHLFKTGYTREFKHCMSCGIKRNKIPTKFTNSTHYDSKIRLLKVYVFRVN